ncbi:hypothetical protein [Merismopedia glauca]|uniref:PEP-CTERM sorting domain-containing protein n=1 Tax=Merismopedia glauca CCAP 1448/3 TaxID=1296344 RepID=A0A2T1BZ06_9CYAN|nr:hypothetical protein [Merismopedia glauca]PSB01232.1 hypothetical protein C7B64_19475 [Merismopedia glauca CCAP 1448/3]
MFECKLYKSPLLISALTVQLLSSSLASVRAASVNLDNPQEKSDCPKLKSGNPQALENQNSEPSGESGLLPKQQSEIVNLSNSLSQDQSSNLIAQLPESGTPRPLDSGCEVSGEGACEISGDSGCEVGGPPPAGGGILPAIAAAGGFPLAALAPLGILPFIGGGDNNNPPPEGVPEPSTVFGSVIALGVVATIGRKRGFSTRRKRKK